MPRHRAALRKRGHLQGFSHKVLGRNVLALHRQGQVGGENRLLGLFFPSLFGSHNASLSAEFCLSHDSSP